jgi:RNA polymerase sigma-70 factor (ECF subfamily)
VAPGDRHEVTALLRRASAGDDVARSALFDVLYSELRKLAEAAMRRERSDHTLQPTALVHETFVRLADDGGRFENRAHFFGVAASAMRRVLVDHARSRRTQKRGGGTAFVDVDDLDSLAGTPAGAVDLVALDDALSRLSSLDPRQGRVVELRFFAGLSVEETAAILDLSPRTVKREWQMARAWLRREFGHH